MSSTPAEVLAGDAGKHARFRLGGMVKENSIVRVEGSLESRFTVSDGGITVVGKDMVVRRD